MTFQNKLTLLVAQTTSSNTHARNIQILHALADRASEQRCDMLCLPEASGLMNQDPSAGNGIVTEQEDPYVATCRALARTHKIWIHNGSTPVLGPAGLAVNRTLLFDDTGAVVARYDKIHLFDIYLPDGKDRLESKRYSPGNQSVLALSLIHI